MHETIEGEVILIDLTTGSYYSLREAGAVIWHAIEQGGDEDDIGMALESRYEGSRDEMRDGARMLIAELEAEHLIEESGSAAPASLPARSENGSGSRMPFRAPVLEKYTDMQDLVLIDPVHQVGESGWPHVRSDAPAPATDA
jgi:hypothetical protein